MSKFLFRILILFLVGAMGCTELPIIEVEETDETTHSSLGALSEVLSTFDIVQDYALSSDLLYKKDESLIPSSVLISYVDTTFKDGNGIELIFDFGSLGAAPHGVLCKDEKYRAGEFVLKLNKPYTYSDARLKIEFGKDNPFYSGNGQTMSKLKGSLTLSRSSLNEVILRCSDLVVQQEDIIQSIESNVSVMQEKDFGPGIVNDELTFAGYVNVTEGSVVTRLKTISPLYKNYKMGCAMHIIKGEMDVQMSSSKSEIHVDFDPYDDMACDNKVELTINGKSVLFEY
ncbi:MAG: hypothetical protein ACPGTP_09185 [Bacteroidia bacterium]